MLVTTLVSSMERAALDRAAVAAFARLGDLQRRPADAAGLSAHGRQGISFVPARLRRTDASNAVLKPAEPSNRGAQANVMTLGSLLTRRTLRHRLDHTCEQIVQI